MLVQKEEAWKHNQGKMFCARKLIVNSSELENVVATAMKQAIEMAEPAAHFQTDQHKSYESMKQEFDKFETLPCEKAEILISCIANHVFQKLIAW
jgi:adenosyl cobinamide kinase/adenosyl cobinamide phosphate guanylyltransferase